MPASDTFRRVLNRVAEPVVLFPVIESVHLLALVVISGSVLVVDMRLFGLGLRSQPVAQVSRDSQPWLVGSLVVMFASK